MRWTLFLVSSLLCIFSCSCSFKSKTADDSTLVSIQIIDRNGFAETISSSDRLGRYQKADFKGAQPYQKVLRVFGKDEQGQTPSIITSYHANGHLWQYLEISNGRAHGTYQEWHFNGHKKMDLHVIEGIPELSDAALKSWVFDGTNQIWDEQGALVAEISYEKGFLQGDSFYYYPSGQIKRQIPYVQDEMHGSLICYHENGDISEIIPHIKGVRHGIASSFFPNKTLAYQETFEDGRLMEGQYYSEKGDLISSILAGSGRRYESESGSLKRLVQYEKGVPDGLIECLDDKGNLKISFTQKEGKKHGEEWEYYPKESPNAPLKPKLLLHWQEDVLQGMVKTWFQSGKQESQKEMYQNKKNGVAYAWYENGDLMLSEEYEKDILSTGTYYKKGDKKPVSKVFQGKGIATLYHPSGYLLQKVSYEKGAPSLENDSTK